MGFNANDTCALAWGHDVPRYDLYYYGYNCDAAKTKLPQILKSAVPNYPPELEHDGIEGDVMVQLMLSDSGGVTYASVVKTTDPRFNRSAMLAGISCKFSPATCDGKPVPFWVVLPYRFRLRR